MKGQLNDGPALYQSHGDYRQCAMRAMQTFRLYALLGIAVLVSCQPALFVPRHGPMAQRPTAVLTGTLTVRDGCAWIVTPDERFLALWPSTFVVLAAGAGIAVSGNGVQVTVGDEVTVGGGEYPPQQTDFVESLIDESVPEGCRHRYWLVTELLSEPLPT